MVGVGVGVGAPNRRQYEGSKKEAEPERWTENRTETGGETEEAER